MGSLPGSLRSNPRISQWLRFEKDGAEQCLSLYPGKVEIGQGIVTALVQIAAHYLGLHINQIRACPASTESSPNEQVTSGSLSIQECGAAIAYVARQARHLLVSEFAALKGVDLADLDVREGSIFSASAGIIGNYWELDTARLLNVDACDFDEKSSSRATPILSADALIGQSIARLDLAKKFEGKPSFIHDMRLPEMRFAMMLRGSAQRAQIAFVQEYLTSEHSAGDAGLIVDGRFAALWCSRLSTLMRLQKKLNLITGEKNEVSSDVNSVATKAALGDKPHMSQSELSLWLRTSPSELTQVLRKGDVDSISKVQSKTFDRQYFKPWLSHASIGLSCAIALYVAGEKLEVWSHSQGIYNLRRDMFLAFGSSLNLSEEQFVIHHVEGAGCYGHNGADDVAFDAARVAIDLAGKPVRLQWTRPQELQCAPFSPAMLVHVKASVDDAAAPRICLWHHTVFSNGHSLRPGRANTPTLLGASEVEGGNDARVSVNAAMAVGAGSERNSVPLYGISNVLVENHRLLQMPVRSSAFRGLGAIANVFAIESMVDEIALHLKEDPLDIRLRHLDSVSDQPDQRDHQRAQAVLLSVAEQSGWRQRKLAIDTAAAQGKTLGYGLAFARYKNTGAWCAVVAQIELTERVRVHHLWISVDMGCVVNPDGARNQLQGAAIQSTSIALLEDAAELTYSHAAPASWESYPILRFSDVPRVSVELINQPSQPSLGAGEPATAPVVAAIANAITSITGKPLTRMPFTPETITATL